LREIRGYSWTMRSTRMDSRVRRSETSPGKVLDRDYLDALRERVAATEHLRSLQKLFTVWDSLSTGADPEPAR